MNYKFKTDGSDYLKIKNAHFKEHKQFVVQRQIGWIFTISKTVNINYTEGISKISLSKKKKKKPKIKY